jgi:hypothetical protein
MKHIKKFNENTQNTTTEVEANDYNPSKGRGDSYKENLGRANNEEVHKILTKLENIIGNDIQNIITKIEDQVKAGKINDTDTRNIAVAIGHIVYNKMK